MAPAIRLRPGVHVVRRDATCVQVGLDPPQRVLVGADPDNLRFVEGLRHSGHRGPLDPEQTRIVRELGAAGLLEPPAEHAASSGTVAVQDHGFPEAVARLRVLLATTGVELATGGVPDLVVLCSAAPLPRALVDPCLTDGTPHLVVCGTGHPGSLRVGPLVEPGLTACLRCVDAAEAVDDPRRPLIVEQLAVRSAAPIDQLTVELALAWAARDITSFLRQRAPATWSASVDAHAPVPAPRPWARHPDCGCCWDELPY